MHNALRVGMLQGQKDLLHYQGYLPVLRSHVSLHERFEYVDRLPLREGRVQKEKVVGALEEVLKSIDVRVIYTEQVLNYFHVGALFLSVKLLAIHNL